MQPTVDELVSHLASDNSKLRTLVHDMNVCISVNMRCDVCGRFGSCPMPTFEERMVDTGVLRRG